MTHLEDLLALCQGHKIYIQTHNFPDPDAIASAYGLQALLAHFGVESRLCYDGMIDKLSASKMLDAFSLQMVSYKDLSAHMKPDDKIICVDSQKHGGNVTDFVGDEFACIDHHPTFVPMEYQYKDIRIVGACASLIAEYYFLSDVKPSQDVATALLYGLKMDTLQFSRGVTELDIQMFGYLFHLCNQEKLSDLERNSMEFMDLRAYGAAIEDIELYGKVAFSHIPFHCPDGLIAAISDFMLSLVEVEVAVVSSRRTDGVKISVRSEDPEVHAGDLLHAALEGVGNGGGHAPMAGGFIGSENLPDQARMQKGCIRGLILDALSEGGKTI